MSDTAQLAIFVRGVTKTFEVIRELLDLRPIKGTAMGQDTFNELKRVSEMQSSRKQTLWSNN